jgi:hypothetical protein
MTNVPFRLFNAQRVILLVGGTCAFALYFYTFIRPAMDCSTANAPAEQVNNHTCSNPRLGSDVTKRNALNKTDVGNASDEMEMEMDTESPLL